MYNTFYVTKFNSLKTTLGTTMHVGDLLNAPATSAPPVKNVVKPKEADKPANDSRQR